MTEQRGELTADTHQVCVCCTDDRAFPREGDAARKHLDVVLFQTFRSTVLTFGSTAVTGFDAITEHIRAENLVMHRGQLMLKLSMRTTARVYAATWPKQSVKTYTRDQTADAAVANNDQCNACISRRYQLRKCSAAAKKKNAGQLRLFFTFLSSHQCA